ncbi:oxysterol binding protein [Roridomyces roridus]|uniref:Oxysterol binding protein n=1 Tax=Roridomyces roridus TaxID=1738132 RepID=A0AAD7FP57_9AGAR|nr:oxysterol binding protein [Roridomyces roridus]
MSTTTATIVMQGYVLKKRRKKMQGFARRWFILYNTGILEYSFDVGQPVRDQVSSHRAAISTAPGRKDIHIDSSSADAQREHAQTWHLRCLSTDDFEQWMTAFRRFIGPGPESRRSTTLRLARQGGNKSGVVLEEMSQTLAELESAFNAISHDTPSLKPKGDKEKEKKFGLFKRSSHHSDMDSREPLDKSPAQRVHDALEMLKAQHAVLVKSMLPLSFLDTSQSQRGSPLLATTEEEPAGLVGSPSPSFSTAISRKHASILTTTTSENEWFDADDDGAEEFILDIDIPALPDSRQPSNIISNDSRSSLGGSSAEEAQAEPDSLTTSQTPRRTCLPAGPVGDEGSLFAVLKKNVGKDLSTIAVPITFNEPLTLLQRTAEEIEYYDLLNLAAASTDPVERMCYIAAFTVSSYAHTRHRTGRKAFNPMLGETFELEDSRMKFIAEKVRHQPLEMAYHAEGLNREWELTGNGSGKTKFWGKSLEIIPLGTTYLKIGDDHFEWKRPSSFMRNLMVGTKYLEHVGKMNIDNTRTGARCVIEFKPAGFWGASNLVSGVVHDPSGEAVAKLEGKWDDQLSQMLDDSHFRILWRAAPFPTNTLEYYGFTSFGISLNEITGDMKGKVAPTDSRWRPDVRALEEGRLEEAEEAKSRVEEAQRERRRKGMDAEPRWFALVGSEWEYTGGYWEARANEWKGAGIKPLW